MIKYILFILVIFSTLNSAVIVGNQEKVSSMGGKVNVTSEGRTVELEMGEITFTEEGKAPTEARKIGKGDISDILEDTSVADKLVNLKVGSFPKEEAMKIYKDLRNYFDKANLDIRKYRDNYDITIINVYYSKLEKVFPKIKKYIKNN